VKTKEQISYNMSRVRSSGTMIERKLGKALWAAGVRYRKQYKKLIGKPDFVVVWAKIAIFCDSSFWHGRNWATAQMAIKTNKDYWIPKIESNIMRDEQVNAALTQLGWRVFRFWDEDIHTDAAHCASMIVDAIKECGLHGATKKSSSD
jgi:DNA mismatch endonuclease (patch repair protein)